MRRILPEHFRPDGRAKVSYTTEGEAQQAAEVAQERHGSKRRPYHAYQCYCEAWHVGRKPPPGRRARHRESVA